MNTVEVNDCAMILSTCDLCSRGEQEYHCYQTNRYPVYSFGMVLGTKKNWWNIGYLEL